MSPWFEVTEAAVVESVAWLKLCAESASAIVITAGLVLCLWTSWRTSMRDGRLRMGRFLAYALELQLAADILSTSIAPSWEQIGKLAAIAIIRTTLNWFLVREIREEAPSTASSSPAAQGN